jgi:hypothetical protein
MQQGPKEAPVADIRSDHARARAMALLAIADPDHHDVESCRLRELAMQYIAEADRLEAERGDDAAEPSESISAALDDVARSCFERTLYGTASYGETSFRSERKQAAPNGGGTSQDSTRQDSTRQNSTRQVRRTS